MIPAIQTWIAAASLSFGAFWTIQSQTSRAVWLEDLDISKMSAGWGSPQVGLSCEKRCLTLGGVAHAHGVGTHAPSELLIDIGCAATKFEAIVGLDDERLGRGSVTFEVWGDDERLFDSGRMRGGDSPRYVRVNLKSRKRLLLIVTDAGDGAEHDHADWADAKIIMEPDTEFRPATVAIASEPPPNIHSGNSPVPAIHGPKIVGTTPGRPFLFLIPATGTGPLSYSAKGLPPGITLDSRTGILSGAVTTAGNYTVELSVQGLAGTGSRKLNIVAEPGKLALTPPMGWNSWYVWYADVNQLNMTQAADLLVSTGLAAHGYQYVNMDDGWSGKRLPSGEIQPNEKFPDMKRLADHIHSKGLRFGTYTSPGPKTCAGFEGSYQHEAQDSMTYASWGVDFLKHDWCSYSEVEKERTSSALQKPYSLMRRALDATGRDVVYNLCQYGMGDVWKWGAEVGANTWRTTDDSGDTWNTVSNIGFSQNGHEAFAGPGHWNDPDYLQVGVLGAGGSHPTRLTPNEQITQMTLWSLLAAPLFLSCDLSKLDKFTLDLLTNDEVIDVDQDILGKAASRKMKQDTIEVWARPLSDGTTAVGLFNRGAMEQTVIVNWSDVGLSGKLRVRDLWRQTDLGDFHESFSSPVLPHGAMLLRIGPP